MGFWVVLIGVGPADLAFGLLVAAVATWASLHLMPPQPRGLRLMALPPLAVRFVWLSIVAGVDVARRALDPRLPLRPGFVTFQSRLPPGSARTTFVTLTSLFPGSVPAGEENGLLLYHCLDLDQPVAAQLAAEEAEETSMWRALS
ncbi:MAG: Na+/H+ antiporter subunit E [Candidatus Binatia bacterium]